MTSEVEANKAMVRQLLKNNDDKKFDEVPKMVTDDFVGHHHFRPDGIHGPQDLQAFFALTEGTSFPNGHHEITHLLGDGDEVAVTFSYKALFIAPLPDGTQPTNKECEFHYTCIIRFRNGKMSEIWWYCYDAVLLSQQLGYLK